VRVQEPRALADWSRSEAVDWLGPLHQTFVLSEGEKLWRPCGVIVVHGSVYFGLVAQGSQSRIRESTKAIQTVSLSAPWSGLARNLHRGLPTVHFSVG